MMLRINKYKYPALLRSGIFVDTYSDDTCMSYVGQLLVDLHILVTYIYICTEITTPGSDVCGYQQVRTVWDKTYACRNRRGQFKA